MLILYPAEPFAGRVIDAVYGPEQTEAERHGFQTALLDFEALLEGDTRRALRFLPLEPGPLLYRGWMLRAESYARLHAALLERGWTPLHSPEDYRNLHHLPPQFAHLEAFSPRTVWIAGETPAEVDREELRAALATFGAGPLIVKDYVKSRKHEWDSACFIADAADVAGAMQIIETFLSRQGEALQGGVVLRAFETFTPLARHQQSGMPLTLEYRAFVLDGQMLILSEYWEQVANAVPPPLDWIESIAAGLMGRFLTLDVAQRLDGVWRVVEIGDAQVAGLPEQLPVAAFYQALSAQLGG
ncbi:ATP-grasp domain-containing protein [Deinococcus sp.]|uniref:ATP-grasp domain-containing protein n=1 Tax=Deinococcus sp. TaxID=47478 RepID=UPI003B5B66E7